MKKISEKTFTSQTISPPIILTLNQDEVQALETYESQLSMFGYQIEPFGGKEYAITAIPADFTDIDMKTDRKSTRLNSSHTDISRMPSSA